MNVEEKLQQRSKHCCELCSADSQLQVYPVGPESEASEDDSVYLCADCRTQIDNPASLDPDHWRCLNDSMWSPVPAVQVLAWRMLSQLAEHGEGLVWAQSLLDMLYLDEEMLAWANAGMTAGEQAAEQTWEHLDSNGAVLSAGDTVTLTKDLNVRGANFTAKRGTAVRGITLVDDNAEQIEGKINGQKIVILTKFVKKAG